MDFTLKQLRVFIETVNAGSMIGAAQKMNMSQPAVSMALSELESAMQEKLFDRWGKRAILNERGRALIPLARQVLSDAEEIKGLFQPHKQNPIGTLHLGASSTLGTYLVPELLAGFWKMYPNVKVKLSASNKSQVISQIEDFFLDVGLVSGFCGNTEIESRFWLNDELCIFCAPEHDLAQIKEITRKDLAEVKWILREKTSGTLEILMNAISHELRSLNVIAELNNTEAIKRAVKIGLGISCLSRMAIKDDLAAGSLVELSTPFLDLTRKHYILIHKNKHKSQLISAFIHYLFTTVYTLDENNKYLNLIN